MVYGLTIGADNVYMPHDDRSDRMVGEYSHILGELQASLYEIHSDKFLCVVDFNADPHRGRLWDQVVGNFLMIPS